MICCVCGGQVLWVGIPSNLTFTECQCCGAINSQIADDLDDDEPQPDDLCECQAIHDDEEIAVNQCAACGGYIN